MSECSNADVRDALPDYVAERLASDDRLRVAAHVATCEACDDEMALLRVARAVRPRAVSIDVARIVAALPTARRRDAVSVPSLQLVRDVNAAAAAVDAHGVQGRHTQRASRSNVWRIAAVIGVAAIGGWSVLANQHTGAPVGAGAAPVAVNRSQVVVPDVAVKETLSVGATAVRGTPALSLGDLSEYSDDDLQRVLDRLDRWDGASSADPLPALPIVPVSVDGTL